MPRQNRKKLHRELRLAAEARQRVRREARLRTLEEAARVHAIVTGALRRGAVRTGARAGQPRVPADQRFAGLRHLLRLAGVSANQQSKVKRLFAVLEVHLPELANAGQLPWMVLLTAPPWVRDPDGFVTPSGSQRRKRDELAQHLLCRFSPPSFLLRALDIDPLAVARVPTEDLWAVHVLAHVGRGASLRTLVGTEWMPAPLTKRMVHLFLGASAKTGPVSALRWAQVGGQGGSRGLHKRLLATALGELQGPDRRVGEPFWHDVIGWLCRTRGIDDLNAMVLGDLVDWIGVRNRAARAEGRVFALKGRTTATVLREVSRWRVDTARSVGHAFPASGLLPYDAHGWTVLELTSPAALVREGRLMRHCVAMYKRLAGKRKVAVFSLQHHGSRRATVEVSLGAGRVVQVKGKANSEVGMAERQAVGRWSADNGLSVGF